MKERADWLPFGAQVEQALNWLAAHADGIRVATIWQAAAIAGAYVLAWLLAPHVQSSAASLTKWKWLEPHAPLAARIPSPLMLPAIWLSLLWICLGIAHQFSMPCVC